MKTIIFTIFVIALMGGILVPFRNESGFNTGVPALAQCSTWEIKNNCCFKFFKILESPERVEPMQLREKMAVAEYKRCLDKDLGCSSELIGLKAKNARDIRDYCK